MPAELASRPRPVQVIPSVEVATLFPPVPTATHKLFPYVTRFPKVEKTVLPRLVHVIPSVLVPMVFVV